MATSNSSPPYSSGIIAPNNPNSFIRSTRSKGYSSACSICEAAGTTSLRTNSRMVLTIPLWASESWVTASASLSWRYENRKIVTRPVAEGRREADFLAKLSPAGIPVLSLDRPALAKDFLTESCILRFSNPPGEYLSV